MFHDFVNLFYPKVCQVCNSILVKGEDIICVSCLHELPVTNYHLNKENPVVKVFYGRIPIENATALLEFQKKGSVQKLIHQLKYRKQKEISSFLGRWLGEEITATGDYKDVDIVIPVPLHRKKLKIRGFNQVEGFGKEIAKALEVPYKDDVLLKKSFSTTQTLKERLSRWGNIQETFVLTNAGTISNKHVLLVDDIITTGATLEACAQTLQQVPKLRISIATMAIAG